MVAAWLLVVALLDPVVAVVSMSSVFTPASHSSFLSVAHCHRANHFGSLADTANEPSNGLAVYFLVF
jgi:hypothetical protein